MNDDVEVNVESPVFEVVCAISQTKAELFIRNSANRLVPLCMNMFRRLQQAHKRLKESNNPMANKNWLYGDLEPVALELGLAEYHLQVPNEQEKKRRDKICLFKDLQIERLVWSSNGPISDESLQQYLEEGKSIGDYVVSRLDKYPEHNITTVIIANKSLAEDEIKYIWDSYLNTNTKAKAN